MCVCLYSDGSTTTCLFINRHRKKREGGFCVYVLETQTALFSFCVCLLIDKSSYSPLQTNTHRIHPLRCAKKNREKGEGGYCVYVLETGQLSFLSVSVY